MNEAIIWFIGLGLITAVVVADFRAGEITLPQRGGLRKRRGRLLLRQYPAIFFTVLFIKIFVGIVLILLITGRLMSILQWGV